MKLLTLNTHSLQENDYDRKLTWFVDYVLQEHPGLIALQEVNQSVLAPHADAERWKGLIRVPENEIPLRWDNHAAEVVRRLRRAEVDCSWTWLPIKVSYDRYDEGVAFLSLDRAIRAVDTFPISRSLSYQNWKTRRVLGVQLEGLEDWFYTVHMGWWGDGEEPFQTQWQTLDQKLAEQKAQGRVWLLGDFNSPAEVRGEGYDCIRAAGWKDTYAMAEQRDSSVTVQGTIDGWQDRSMELLGQGMRLDQIWCSQAVSVNASRVLFNGRRGPRVSDHYAVLVDTDLEMKGACSR